MSKKHIKNALHYFEDKETAMGFYARQKWLKQSKNKLFIEQQKSFIENILNAQDEDGSWSCSFLQTIYNLFNLHLTLRQANENIHQAMLWLIQKTNEIAGENEIKDASVREETETFNWNTIPFLKTANPAFLYSSLLFMSSIYGFSKFDSFKALYKKFSEHTTQQIKTYHLNDQYNFLRGYLVDSQFQTNQVAIVLIDNFAEMQDENGLWKYDINPFYLFNILAHSNDKKALKMVKKAKPTLLEMQQDDGTWGNEESKEMDTFMMVHALKNI